jgi:hypothetical protein
VSALFTVGFLEGKKTSINAKNKHSSGARGEFLSFHSASSRKLTKLLVVMRAEDKTMRRALAAMAAPTQKKSSLSSTPA